MDFYLKNDCRELKRIVISILKTRFGWIPESDYDDFISIGMQVAWDCEKKFDKTKGAEFKTYFINCLLRKIKTRVTFINRNKRCLRDENGDLITNVSLDALIEDGDAPLMTMAVLDSYDFETEKFSDKMTMYLQKLSKTQKKILFLISEDYSSDEIKTMLKITSEEYSDAYATIRSYRNVSILY